MRVLSLAVSFLCGINCLLAGWSPDEDLIVLWENEIRPGFNYREDNVPKYDLPHVLEDFSGNPIRSADEWMQHRVNLLQRFREQVYGIRADAPDQIEFELIEEDLKALGGAAALQRIRIVSSFSSGSFAFELILFLPNDVAEPVPVFLLLNNRGPENTDPTREIRSGFWPAEDLVARGYGIAAIQNNELAADSIENYREGIMRLWPNHHNRRDQDSWGALAAWGWGASRAMDYFETEARIDHAKVAVVGHSRGGKAALWAGAEDERFGLVVSNNSGCGGAALSRRKYGETIAEINRVFPYWFASNFHQYGGEGISKLPVDQHQLIALIAPRAAYVASASEDLWADPRGEYLALAQASPVYQLFGGQLLDFQEMPAVGRPRTTKQQGYHLRKGGHNLTPYDWKRFMDFADKLFR